MSACYPDRSVAKVVNSTISIHKSSKRRATFRDRELSLKLSLRKAKPEPEIQYCPFVPLDKDHLIKYSYRKVQRESLSFPEVCPFLEKNTIFAPKFGPN